MSENNSESGWQVTPCNDEICQWLISIETDGSQGAQLSILNSEQHQLKETVATSPKSIGVHAILRATDGLFKKMNRTSNDDLSIVDVVFVGVLNGSSSCRSETSPLIW